MEESKEIVDKANSSGLENVLLRNIFYKTVYRHAIFLNIAFFVIIILLCLFVGYQVQSTTKPKYFPTQPDGRPISMPPVSINHLELKKLKFENGHVVGMPELKYLELKEDGEDAVILYWAKEAVASMFEYDFVNYRVALQQVRNIFTPKGHAEFLEALEKSKNLDLVKERRTVVYSNVEEGSRIIGRGNIDGALAWKIEVPMAVHYVDTKNEPLIQEVKAVMFVKRISTLESPFYGLAITRINFKVTD